MNGQPTAAPRLAEWDMMYVLHDAFRRDIDALLATRAEPAAIRARWANFADQLHFHHLAEDKVMWPPVRAKLAGDKDGLALMDAMEAEHALIDPLLAEVDEALADGAGHTRLTTALSRLRVTLTGHLAHEESAALPLITRVMTEAGVAGIFKAFGRLGGLKRGSVLLPWALSDASPDIKARIISGFPPPARVLYRVRWEPRYRRGTPRL